MNTPSIPRRIGSDPFSPIVLWRGLRKHWLLAVVVGLAVVLGFLFHTLGQTKIYRATTTLQIQPKPPQPLGNQVQAIVDLGSDSFWANKEYYETQYQILQGRSVCSDTVRSLRLNQDAAFLANTPPGEPTPPLDQPATIEQAASILASRLQIEPVTDSQLVKVNLDDADPERAKRVLTTHVDAFLERNVELAADSTSAARQWLHDQVGELAQDLEHKEVAVHDYKKKNRILSVSLDDQSNMLGEEIGQLSTEITRVKARRQELLARNRELAKIDAEDPVNVPASELLENGLLSSLRQEFVGAKSNLAATRGEGRGEKHPDVVAARARVETSRVALMREVNNIKGAVASDLASVSSQLGGLGGLLEGAKQRALDLGMLEIEYRRLERNKENTEKLYSLVLERSEESNLASLMRFNNIHIQESPTVLKVPVQPRVPQTMVVALLLGTVLGVGAAFARELIDRRLRGPDEVETELELPLLGVLPLADGFKRPRRSRRKPHQDGEATPELTVLADPTSALAEAARSVRTNLMLASPDAPLRRILVTSASPGEGKTMVACSIAIALAQAGQRVALVDCDLRRSRLHRVFNRTNDVGVTSVLIEPELLETTDLSSSVPNLSVLPAGPRAPTPAELIQSQAFARFLDDLSNRYDRIVLDSAPLGPVTDAAILAAQVDGTVFVVRALKTRLDVATRALRTLADLGARVAGGVLNAVDLNRSGYGYYYYYAQYGYRYHGARADN